MLYFCYCIFVTYIQGGSIKDNRNLEDFLVFNIESTEINFHSWNDPAQFSFIVDSLFLKFKVKLSKYESNEKSRSKPHIPLNIVIAASDAMRK